MSEEGKLKHLEDTLQGVIANYQDIDRHASVAIVRRIEEEIHKISTLQGHLKELKEQICSQITKEKAESLLFQLENFYKELAGRYKELQQEKEMYH